MAIKVMSPMLARECTLGIPGEYNTPNGMIDSSINGPVSMRRVLLMIDQFTSPHAGTEQHLLFLCRHLPKTVRSLHFAVLTAVRRADPAVFPIQPYVLPQARGPAPLRFLGRVRASARLIAAEQIDVVQTFCPMSELAAVLATRLAGRGLVVGCRRNIGYWHSTRTLWRARLVTRFVSHFVANCEAAKQFGIANERIELDRISVITNPVDVQRLQDGTKNPIAREAAGIQSGERVVGIVATVRPIKDHETYFRAARMVLERHPRTRFLVVGDDQPAHRQRLVQLVAWLGIERQVSWLGPVANAYRVLPHFDVGVLSSRSEGYSNALLEYAAAGVPAVATDVGGTSEVIVDGQTGFLVPPADPEAMAARITLLLDHPDLAQTLGRQAKTRALAECAPDKVIAQYCALYSRLLAASRENTMQPEAAKAEK